MAVLVAAFMVPGISYQNFTSLLVASLLLGILNALVKPFLLLLSLPLLVLSLGFFLLIINAGLLSLVGWLVKGFNVAGFWSAVFGALIISIVNIFLNSMTGTGNARVTVNRGGNPQGHKPHDHRNDDDDGGGPIIDV